MFELSHGSFSTFHIMASASVILRSKRNSRCAGSGITHSFHQRRSHPAKGRVARALPAYSDSGPAVKAVAADHLPRSSVFGPGHVPHALTLVAEGAPMIVDELAPASLLALC